MQLLHKIKQHDTGQRLGSILTIDGQAYDLTGKTVWFIMTSEETGTLIKNTAVVVGNPTQGSVEYAPSDSDVGTSGAYKIEWEVVDDLSGERLTFPHDDYQQLLILEDLG